MSSSTMRSLSAAAAALLLATACGTGQEGTGSSDDGAPPTTIVRAPGDPKLAGDAITAFGNDLFTAVASQAEVDENVVVSPTSVAIALGMLEPGTSGEATPELRKLLRIEDPGAFHASMGALEQSLEQRKTDEPGPGANKPGEITMRVANAAYVQKDYPVKPAYLDAITSHYGPAVKPINFDESAKAADEVNKFIAEATRDHIKDLVKDDTFSEATVMALVNALYLKASWVETFDKSQTKEGPFTRLDNRKVTVPLMSDSSDSSSRGDNWVGAIKSYVGGLAAQFILPNEGAFGAVAGDLERVLADYPKRQSSGAKLVVPRFKTRTEAELRPALKSLGLQAPFKTGSLLGVADDPLLLIAAALHATFLSMDEEGIEAAAATVLVGNAVSAPADPPVPVILDRPFIFRILDTVTGATLFVGRVMDPTT